MIAAVVPSGTAAVEARDDMRDAFLLPEEAAALGHVAEVRRREFTLARSCGRRALTRLGFAPVPVLRGADREPIWPAGIVGSITHCRGYCAAALAPAARLVTIGIDAEVHAALPRGILQMVSVDEERDWIRSAPDDGICWDRLLFSAKESVFKAWFPMTRRWLGFEDAAVTVDPDAGTFHARLLVPAPLVGGAIVSGFDGRYAIEDGHIVTAVVVEKR